MLLKVSKNAEPDAENAYASFQGLLQLAKITNADVDLSRGACKKCGRVGHLKFQCKNYVKLQDEKVEKDLEAMQPLGLVGIDNLKGKSEVNKRNNVESSEEEEEDNESSDSEIDSEILREQLLKGLGRKLVGREVLIDRRRRIQMMMMMSQLTVIQVMEIIFFRHISIFIRHISTGGCHRATCTEPGVVA
ncbi:cax-interacting protein 4-like [Trifolium pratense]|uniref:Cax-interacting protein 4-like n=1 Tax=Trifolium pratense TaxID=57577 RepID=A0A2K3PMC1_TRIPR|nr:cax-interacting protein 4-like [Trifolium pratense]